MTPRCPRCNQFLPLLGVHRCPCWEYNREPQPTRIGRWATWLVASSLAFVVLLAVAANATPREGPDASTSHVEVPASLGAPLGPDRPLRSTFGASTHGASLTPPSLPAATASPQPTSALVSVPVPTPPETDTELTGRASWYLAKGMIAAMPWYRWGMTPQRVEVCTVDRCVTVLVQDFCQCYVGTSRERLIDLSDDAFRRLAPLSVGLVRATVTVEDSR